MYTRHTTFPLKSNTLEQAVEIAQKYEKVLHGLPGHVSTVMFGDGDSLVSVSTWDTEEHAEAVTSSARDDAQRDLAELLDGAPSTSIAATAVHDMG